jgi:ribosomal protein S27E
LTWHTLLVNLNTRSDYIDCGYLADLPYTRILGREGTVSTMGHQVKAKCRDCGNIFTVDHGGGFAFHLLRCDMCGKTKAVGFDALGELHLRYLKGLSGPYCVASSEHDRNIREHAPVEPISEDEYSRGVEAVAGNCICGGKYTLHAPPRCPKCRSTRIEEGESTVCYD